MVAQPSVTGWLHGVAVRGGDASLISLATPGEALASEAKASTDKGAVKWTCPMHPHYIADAAGSCPICGMDLVKLDTGGPSQAQASAEQRTAIVIAPEVIQNMGVRLGTAERSRFGRRIRSFGRVEANERLTSEFTARVEGWVEDLKVTAVGDAVKEGEPLFLLYSPRLIVSQGDYFSSAGSAGQRRRATSQLKAFGVQEQAIKEIRENGAPLDLVPFYADRGGTVTELNLKDGTYVSRGMLLLRVQDYSSVWLKVSVAEQDLPFLAKGASASVTFPGLPGQSMRSTVDYVYPTIDARTRTGQVRLVIPNPDGTIRPGSYADVVFEVDATQRTAVRSEAILRSGDGSHVVVSLGKGRFEPRAVETGLASGGWTEITRGIEPGEDVVVSGQFLLDSESALRESFLKLQRLQLPLSLLDLTKPEMAMVDHLVDAALYLHEALIDGYDLEPGALDPALSIRDALWPRYKNTKLGFILDDATTVLKQAKAARSESEIRATLAALVRALRPWMAVGAPRHYRARDVVLMQDRASGKHWLQVGSRPLNPFSRGASDVIAWPAAKLQSTPAPTPGPARASAEGAAATAAGDTGHDQ